MSSFPNHSRGGFAPRRGRGGWNRPFTKQRVPIKLDTEKHPLGDLVQTFRNSDLITDGDGPAHEASIRDCRYVASYNWLSDKTPTITIPGKPPLWTPLKTAQRLNEDSGQYFRDPNAARYPTYPMAPVVHAIMNTNADFDPAGIHLFACGSTLGNLLRFVRGVDKPFRFNIEVVGDTVFFVRKENDPKELMKDVRGFGHSFPEAYTTWESDVKGSETHQRIVQYNFGGLACMLRFECDGYIKDTVASTSYGNSAVDEDDIIQALQGASISTPLDPTTPNGDALVIKRGGSEISQSTIFDLKTRSGKYNKEIDMSDMYPLLWVKQIPNFIVAYHDGAGLFRDIRVQDVRDDVRNWQKDNSDAIRRLAVLLRKIIDIAKKDERSLLEAVSQEANVLEIRSQYGKGTYALPDDLMYEWVNGKGGSSLADDDCSGDAVGGADEDFVSDRGWNADSDEEPDYTACSAEDCGYCGKCTY